RVADENWDTSRLYEYSMGKAVSNGKIWVVDIDSKDKVLLNSIDTSITLYEPITGYPKTKAIIPTVNGFHLLTSKFNVQSLQKDYPEVEVKKCNPTLLYYPNSLSDETI